MIDTQLCHKMLHASVVVCTGVGKSGFVAALSSDLLKSVGIKAAYIHATDLLHGGINVLPVMNPSVVIYFSHSGFTQEIMTAAHYVKENSPMTASAFVTSASVPRIDGADYVVRYPVIPENNRHRTIPVQASASQILAIGEYVDAFADVHSVEYLLRGHPKGTLGHVYEIKAMN